MCVLSTNMGLVGWVRIGRDMEGYGVVAVCVCVHGSWLELPENYSTVMIIRGIKSN